MRRPGGATLVLVALLVAACTDDGGDEADTGDTDSATSSTAADSTETSDGTTTTVGATALPVGYEGYTSDQYADGRNWLCHPADADENVCDRDLDATLVYPDGTTEVEAHTKADDPPIDCFYVYPTISTDPGLNSDLEPADGQEIRTVVNQAARLNSTCEVYAPVYRQLTLGSLLRRVGGEDLDPT